MGYECLVGYPPFYADDPMSTCRKIVAWKRTLVFPDEVDMTKTAMDLITKLIADVKKSKSRPARLNYKQQTHKILMTLKMNLMISKAAQLKRVLGKLMNHSLGTLLRGQNQPQNSMQVLFLKNVVKVKTMMILNLVMTINANEHKIILC